METSVNGKEKPHHSKPAVEITVNEKVAKADKKKRSREEVEDSRRLSKNGVKSKKSKAKISNSENKQERSSKKSRK